LATRAIWRMVKNNGLLNVTDALSLVLNTFSATL
jgi:hypothetical protein